MWTDSCWLQAFSSLAGAVLSSTQWWWKGTNKWNEPESKNCMQCLRKATDPNYSSEMDVKCCSSTKQSSFVLQADNHIRIQIPHWPSEPRNGTHSQCVRTYKYWDGEKPNRSLSDKIFLKLCLAIFSQWSWRINISFSFPISESELWHAVQDWR